MVAVPGRERMFRRSPFSSTSSPASPNFNQLSQQLAEAAAAAARGDWNIALAIWVGLAHAGNARAQAQIRQCFIPGWGVDRDANPALKRLTPSAKAGDAFGQSLLGDYYFNGEGGSRNRPIAVGGDRAAPRQGE